MDRDTVTKFLFQEVEKTTEELKKLAKIKGDADGPRTSWHSTIHLDIERNIMTEEKYLRRCKSIINSLKNTDLTTEIKDGSIITMLIDNEEGQYIFLEEEYGSSIGEYYFISSKSLIGKAIQNKKAGQTLKVKTPDGIICIEILKVL